MGLKPDHNNCPSALKPGLAVLNPCIPVLNLYLFPVPSVPSVFNFLVFLCALCVFVVNLCLYGQLPPASTLKKSTTS
jgi:hypothetical protein